MRYIYELNPQQQLRLLRIFSETGEINIPESIDGYPVAEIGDYCFADGDKWKKGAKNAADLEVYEKAKEECKSVFLSENEATGNAIISVNLPDSVKSIGAYCFYNCRKLERLSVGKDIATVGSDAFMNTRSLKELMIRGRENEKTGLKLLLAQINADINVIFEQEGNTVFELFYPEYTEVLDEVAPAHLFGRHITGEGFRARQQFSDSILDISRYDALFEQSKVSESPKTLIKMILPRIKYDKSLSEEMKQQYIDYLNEHADVLSGNLAAERNAENLKVILEKCKFNLDSIQKLLETMGNENWPEGVAVIMSYSGNAAREHKKTRYLL